MEEKFIKPLFLFENQLFFEVETTINFQVKN